MTRASLHLVATHVLGRRRYAVSGKFGLRATPGGFGTPAFGDDIEVVRVDGARLVREVGGSMSSTTIEGASLRELAAFVEATVDSDFDAGVDAPALGDVDEALHIDDAVARQIASWFALGWCVLDAVVGSMPVPEAATIQLWPEHFDAGTTITVAPDVRVNLGFSPGDGFEPEPYTYVGPWGDDRPGDASYWNAPFGAVLRAADVLGAPDAEAACIEFVQTGIAHLRPVS